MTSFIIDNGVLISILVLLVLLTNHAVIILIVRKKEYQLMNVHKFYASFIHAPTRKSKKLRVFSYFLIFILLILVYLSTSLPLNDDNYNLAMMIYFTASSIILSFFGGNFFSIFISYFLLNPTNTLVFQKNISLIHSMLGVTLLIFYIITRDTFFLFGQFLTLIGFTNFIKIIKNQ